MISLDTSSESSISIHTHSEVKLFFDINLCYGAQRHSSSNCYRHSPRQHDWHYPTSSRALELYRHSALHFNIVEIYWWGWLCKISADTCTLQCYGCRIGLGGTDEGQVLDAASDRYRPLLCIPAERPERVPCLLSDSMSVSPQHILVTRHDRMYDHSLPLAACNTSRTH